MPQIQARRGPRPLLPGNNRENSGFGEIAGDARGEANGIDILYSVSASAPRDLPREFFVRRPRGLRRINADRVERTILKSKG
jgi:hypothetical protein